MNENKIHGGGSPVMTPNNENLQMKREAYASSVLVKSSQRSGSVAPLGL
jgi:hypothetical protein